MPHLADALTGIHSSARDSVRPVTDRAQAAPSVAHAGRLLIKFRANRRALVAGSRAAFLKKIDRH
jgi:hypothetical protein